MIMLLKVILCILLVKGNKALDVTLRPTEQVYALENGDVEFKCSSTPYWTSVQILDRKVSGDNQVTQIFAQRNSSTCNIIYENKNDKYSVSECGLNSVPFTFMIKDINKTFNGAVVTCKVTILDTGTFQATTTVRIREPLQLVTIQPTGSTVVQENTQLHFNCSANSYPVSTLQWYKGGQTVSSSTTSTYNNSKSSWIYTSDKEDNGKNIYCIASNKFESINSSTVTLNITYRPVVQILPSYNPYGVVENTTNFQLTCNVTEANPGVTTYSWFKNNTRVSSSSVHSLSTVKQADAGRYSCGAGNDVGLSDRSRETVVDVLYGVTLFSIPSKQQNEETLLQVTCDGQSNPAVTDSDVRWTKNGNGTFSRTGKTLMIANINRRDSGVFVCTVTVTLTPSVGDNKTVTASTSVTVDVLYRPSVQVVPSHEPFRVIENTTNLRLTCDVIESNPDVTSYRWYKEGDNSVISTDKVYTIPTVTKYHAGKYSCEAGNTVGSSPNSTRRTIDVLYGVMISPINRQPHDGNQLNLTCDGQSNPSLTDSDVRWTKNNNGTFSQTGKNILIPNVNRQDSGVFVCTVILTLTPSVGDNKTVTASTSVTVDVLYRPIVKVVPFYQPFRVIENTTNLRLTCDVIESNPNVTSYRWYKGGDNSVISTDKVYTIPTVTKDHAGEYSCEAGNTVGSSSKSTGRIIDVLYGAILNSIPKQQPIEGHEWSVTCNGQSNPVITDKDITWTKQGNATFKRNGKQLTFTNVNRQDRGNFICTATVKLTPSIGDSVNVTHYLTIIVDVLYRPAVSAILMHESQIVKENTTNLKMICNVSDANPSVDTYRWFKNFREISRSALYTISKVERTHTGKYNCDANNSIGFSDKSTFIELNVTYGVSLLLSTNKQVTNETLTWSIKCFGDGNPPPNYTWKYLYNDTIIKTDDSKQNESTLIKQHANCMDTGAYEVNGKNGIGQDVRLMYEIEVQCKPRSDIRKQEVFIREKNGNISISTTFIGFPLPDITWTRQNETNVDGAVIVETGLPYGKSSSLTKIIKSNEDYGVYNATASNRFGLFIVEFHVKPKTVPDSPALVKAACGVSSAEITWVTPFDGGDNITSFVIVLFTENDNTSVNVSLNDFPEKDQQLTRTVSSLRQNTNYTFHIEAVNSIGTTRSDKSHFCVTDPEKTTTSAALIGGVAGGVASVCLISVVVLGALFIIRRKKLSGDQKQIIRKSRTNEENSEDEDGLKDCIVYGMSLGNHTQQNEVPEYSVVNKNTKSKEIVSKEKSKNIPQKKKNKDHKAIEMGTVYENADDIMKRNDAIYANSSNNETADNKGYNPKRNKDGLLYADLEFAPQPNGNRFVIIGLENKTNYACIDLTQKAEPLPSDDEDDDNTAKEGEHTADE